MTSDDTAIGADKGGMGRGCVPPKLWPAPEFLRLDLMIKGCQRTFPGTRRYPVDTPYRDYPLEKIHPKGNFRGSVRVSTAHHGSDKVRSTGSASFQIFGFRMLHSAEITSGGFYLGVISVGEMSPGIIWCHGIPVLMNTNDGACPKHVRLELAVCASLNLLTLTLTRKMIDVFNRLSDAGVQQTRRSQQATDRRTSIVTASHLARWNDHALVTVRVYRSDLL